MTITKNAANLLVKAMKEGKLDPSNYGILVRVTEGNYDLAFIKIASNTKYVADFESGLKVIHQEEPPVCTIDLAPNGLIFKGYEK